jgi:hypothetical protein
MNNRKIQLYNLFRGGSGLLLGLLSLSLWANSLLPQDVPSPLQPWVEWVLHDTQDYTCPPTHNQSPHLDYEQNLPPNQRGICQWPSRLTLNVNATQASFSQQWQVYSPGWLTLPGDFKNWPQSVQVNDTKILVADKAGVPSIFAPSGQLTIKGQFHWQQRPEFLQIPPNTGLVALTIDDTTVAIAEFDRIGRLWLTKRGASSDVAEENRLDMRVYRRIVDDIPLQVITRVELDVAGRHREVMLGPIMLAGQQAMSLNTPLPARLEADGHLRLQVRPGTWVLTLHTRQEGATDQLTLPLVSEKQLEKQLWINEEVWVFEARNDLRLVEIAGVTAIDPQQTALPRAWRKFPAYLMAAGNTLKFIEKRPGDPEPAPDKLTLARHFWLDFDGQGYSVQDHISGNMTRGWRLEMAEPGILGRVAVNGQDQFITRLTKDSNTGVEVRHGQINLVADSRLENALMQLPAIGWTHDFQQVSTILHLPPGWRLLNAIGVDNVPGTWFKRWTLLDLFIVLIMAAAIGKLWHWGWGMLTLITLILIYHEPYAPHWVWLNIIAAIALLRVLPTLGWFSRLVRWYRELSLIGLLIIALPFMMQQVRQSIYPQLENPSANLEVTGVTTTSSANWKPKSAMNLKDKYAEELDLAAQLQEPLMDLMPGKRRYQSAQVLQSGKVQSQLVQIDPNAQVQTGPGLPQWKWRNINMGFSGPVEQNQSITLWLLSPIINSSLSGVRVGLLAILTVFLLWVSWGPNARKNKPVEKAGNPVKTGNSEFSEKCPNKSDKKIDFTLPMLLVGLLISWPFVSHAEILRSQAKAEMPADSAKTPKALTTESANVHHSPLFPPQALLDELQKRLLAPPDCLPHCASSPRLLVELDSNNLSLRMEIHSLTTTAVPLPGIAKQWLPQQIFLNDKPAQGLFRNNGGQLWLNVTEGIHQVHLIGPLPKRNTVQLALPLKSHSVKVNAKGWRVEGVYENGIADDQLQFTREQTDDSQLAELEMGNLPPYVKIERTLLLGLDWQIVTRVTRLTPRGSAIVLEIPLLTGESVTTENIRVANGNALINMAPNDHEINWMSVFDKHDTITLTAPNNTFSSEVWRLDASAIWHVEIEGIPVIHHKSEGRWLPQWQPWPGETVTLHLTRPQEVSGQVLTIDRSKLVVSPGQRVTDNWLLLNLRSSRGMQHKITLPEDAILQAVKINGKSQPQQQEGRIVTLPITPGAQRVELQFQQAIGMSQHFQTPQVELGIDSVNTNIEIKMQRDRWILFVGGEPIGPAVMIWGMLIVIVLASIGLGLVKLTPLKIHHWLLLGVVLSQVPVPQMLAVVGWFMALGWRGQMADNMSALKFDATQIGLALFTIGALLILLFAIKQGLLGHPNMHIGGNGSDFSHLRWYEDRTTGTLPQVWVFSWSMWIYRFAMLLWALWLSFALMRWLRWGWESFSKHGLWKPLRTKKAVRI